MRISLFWREKPTFAPVHSLSINFRFSHRRSKYISRWYLKCRKSWLRARTWSDLWLSSCVSLIVSWPTKHSSVCAKANDPTAPWKTKLGQLAITQQITDRFKFFDLCFMLSLLWPVLCLYNNLKSVSRFSIASHFLSAKRKFSLAEVLRPTRIESNQNSPIGYIAIKATNII